MARGKKAEEEGTKGTDFWKYLTTWERRAMHEATARIAELHDRGKNRKEEGCPLLWSRASDKILIENLRREEKTVKKEEKKLRARGE